MMQDADRKPPASSQPKVALIVNTYQQAHWLGQALDSAVAQSRRFDEIIVVDDGSTDAPDAVVRDHPGVRLIRQENRGLAAARNTGLAATQADFVVFLDADDLLGPDAVADGLACHAEHPGASLVYGAFRRIGEDGQELGGTVYSPIRDDPYRELLCGNLIGMHATVMYDRRLLSTAGGFDPAYRRCEDYEAYLRLARARGRFASHPRVTAFYRWHGGNMSARHADMLKWVLQVNASQEPYTRNDQALERARLEGRRIWKGYYAEQFAADLQAQWRETRSVTGLVRGLAEAPLPAAADVARDMARMAVRAVRRKTRRGIDWGDFGTTTPLSPDFGFDRGLPVDRHYIERFLDLHRDLVRGRVLEIGDATYSRRFGGERVTRQDVLFVNDSNPEATIVGDIADPAVLPADAFDCIVLTQTLHLIYDMAAAVRNLHKALKPGGTLLATVPGISPIDRGQWGDTWYWSLTRASASRLFGDVFGPRQVSVGVDGNVYAATAFLQGAAVEEVVAENLAFHDPAYPVVVSVVARKAAEAA